MFICLLVCLHIYFSLFQLGLNLDYSHNSNSLDNFHYIHNFWFGYFSNIYIILHNLNMVTLLQKFLHFARQKSVKRKGPVVSISRNLIWGAFRQASKVRQGHGGMGSGWRGGGHKGTGLVEGPETTAPHDGRSIMAIQWQQPGCRVWQGSACCNWIKDAGSG